MLTLDVILKTQRQMTAYGEGRHQFGGPEVAKPPLKADKDTKKPEKTGD